MYLVRKHPCWKKNSIDQHSFHAGLCFFFPAGILASKLIINRLKTYQNKYVLVLCLFSRPKVYLWVQRENNGIDEKLTFSHTFLKSYLCEEISIYHILCWLVSASRGARASSNRSNDTHPSLGEEEKWAREGNINMRSGTQPFILLKISCFQTVSTYLLSFIRRNLNPND